jgi:dolichol-phosphate mannosyltransferase
MTFARPRVHPRLRTVTGRARTAGASTHLYDVGGFVSIASAVELPELDFFRREVLVDAPDIQIGVGLVGRRRLRRSLRVRRGERFVSYEEHLGALAANFAIELGETVSVTVAPFLARSPHVVYTNIVEALLRFVLVSRGYILLHSATIELHGRGVMLSARTDTGKTTTILRLLSDSQGAFLSDDMTILEPDGTAHCYPKPLTISAHTVQAVDTAVLTRRERLALKLQSRLHSREGRSCGQRLADMNLPIMAINALTQMLVPPPKYHVGRLVPCRLEQTLRVEQLFLIERGPRDDGDVAACEAVEFLLENTEDAYGFPPYRYFAPPIALGDDDYAALRARERAILEAALAGVHVRRMARDDYSWSQDIPPAVLGDRWAARDDDLLAEVVNR